MRHFLSIDLESAHHAGNLRLYFAGGRHDADAALLMNRVPQNAHRLLRILAAHDVHATWFVLGSIAEKFPDLIDDIASAGHEIASHGSDHVDINRENRRPWSDDVEKSLRILEPWAAARSASGWGYRAPNFTLAISDTEAYRILASLGVSWSSSVMAARIESSEWASLASSEQKNLLAGKEMILETSAGTIRELPLPGARFMNVPLPFGGGFWLRCLPMMWNLWRMRQCETAGQSFHLYIHPWEVDPEQQHLSLPLWRHFRQYGGQKKMLSRIDLVLSEFSFRPLG